MNNSRQTLVSLSCHIIVSLNDCWSCTMCCRCYRLGYRISAAAPYTALNHDPIQCNVEAARVFTMFMRLLIYVLFTLIQLWSVLEKTGSVTSTAS